VLRDRNPLYVRLSDGGVRNGYTLKILNKLYDTRKFAVETEGLPSAEISIVGMEQAGRKTIEVPSDDLRILRIYIRLPKTGVANLKREITPFSFKVTDVEDNTVQLEATTFRRPKQ